MSRNRFNVILQALQFTTNEPPRYLDRFWRVRPIIQEWNDNMRKIFVPSWVCCLDESMSLWTNKWTCPGWMCVPLKPWSFGNKYHSMCCALTCIMFVIDFVKGKDKPPQRATHDRYHSHSPTVALLLHMCKCLNGLGRVIILDSGFCVMKAICELYKKGIYAGALIKKRRYWPKHVPGDTIDAHMSNHSCEPEDLKAGRWVPS